MESYFACPACGHRQLKLKYEVSYEYSYILDSNAPGLKNDIVFQPYLYDDRVQKFGEECIECCSCKKRYPCLFQGKQISLNQIQNILTSPAQ